MISVLSSMFPKDSSNISDESELFIESRRIEFELCSHPREDYAVEIRRQILFSS